MREASIDDGVRAMKASSLLLQRIDPTHVLELSKTLAGLRAERKELLRFLRRYPVCINLEVSWFMLVSEDDLDAVVEWLEGELARVAGFSPRKFHAKGAYR